MKREEIGKLVEVHRGLGKGKSNKQREEEDRRKKKRYGGEIFITHCTHMPWDIVSLHVSMDYGT